MNGLTLLLTGTVLLGAVFLLLGGGQTLPFWILAGVGATLLFVLGRIDKRHRPSFGRGLMLEILFVAVVVVAVAWLGGVP